MAQSKVENYRRLARALRRVAEDARDPNGRRIVLAVAKAYESAAHGEPAPVAEISRKRRTPRA